MDWNQKIIQVILFMPGFLFSLSFHEAAHAYIADKMGDPTAKRLGRVSLSPIQHIDILGTLILPIFGLLFGGFLFGWGKPVPVDYRNLKDTKTQGMWIAAAGPVSNIILAVIIAGVIHTYIYFLPSLMQVAPEHVLILILEAFKTYLILNLALCFFNLIPVQPLDGSKILFGLLPGELGDVVDRFTTRWGMIILLVLIFSGGIRYILWPPIMLVANLLLGNF